MQGGFQTHDKFAAEFLTRRCFGQWRALLVEQFNPFLHGFAQLLVNLRFVVAMHAAIEQAGAAPDEALVFVAPLHKFCVACRVFFDFFASHRPINLSPRPQRASRRVPDSACRPRRDSRSTSAARPSHA